MVAFFFEHFPHLKGVENKPGKYNSAVEFNSVVGLEFDAWFNKPGWPLFVPDLSAGQHLADKSEALAKHWLESKTSEGCPTSKETFDTWENLQIVHFLDKVHKTSASKVSQCRSW